MIQKDDIVEKYGTRYRLESYLRDATSDTIKGSNQRTFLSKNGNTYEFEIWLAVRLHDNEPCVLHIKKPLETRDVVEESCLYERQPGQYVNDSREVNLLTDSYDEWLLNRRDFELKDQGLINRQQRSDSLLIFIYQESLNFSNPKLRVGFKILYYQRKCPTWVGYKVFQKWKNDNPRQTQQMQNRIDEYLKQEKRGNSESGI